jgi:hypothetical protein
VCGTAGGSCLLFLVLPSFIPEVLPCFIHIRYGITIAKITPTPRFSHTCHCTIGVRFHVTPSSRTTLSGSKISRPRGWSGTGDKDPRTPRRLVCGGEINNNPHYARQADHPARI